MALDSDSVFGSLPRDVESILANPPAAISAFLMRPPVKTLRFFAQFHLPFLLLLPVFELVSPYRLIRGGGFYIPDLVGFPTILIVGLIVLGAVYDRMQRYSMAAGIDPHRSDFFDMRPEGKNLSLFLYQPVSASVFLFFFHPVAGYLALVLTGVYCAYQSILGWARLRGQTIMEAFSVYVVSAGLLLLPLLLLVLAYNLLKTFRIFREIYS